MEVISDYSEYLSKYLSEVKGGNTKCIFSGELSVLKVYAAEGTNLPLEPFYVWDVLNDVSQTVLLKVVYNGKSLGIEKGYFIESSLKDILLSLEIGSLDEVVKWWNLCYYRDKRDFVRYDQYYDRFFAGNKTEKMMSKLNDLFSKWIDESIIVDKGLIYVLGNLKDCNPIIYILQEKGFKVRTIHRGNSERESDTNEMLAQQMKRLATPYSNDNRVTIFFYTLEGINQYPMLCQQLYRVAIPIDLISINDSAVGSFSYKDILPSGEFCRDYSCCGHDYSYVEMELFADLHGNTVLKTTNSNAESRYTIINRFNYTNLKNDGQSN